MAQGKRLLVGSIPLYRVDYSLTWSMAVTCFSAIVIQWLSNSAIDLPTSHSSLGFLHARRRRQNIAGLSHTLREGNQVVDWLAQKQRMEILFSEWMTIIFDSFARILHVRI